MRWTYLRRTQVLALIATCLAFAGCATPAQRIDARAQDLGFEKRIVHGTEFLHVVYVNNRNSPVGRLHVYLEGDGFPWRTMNTVSEDPTPRQPVALLLMALDSMPSIYLGRPCYFGLWDDDVCSPILWTSDRYGERVVASMVAALRTLLSSSPVRELILVGHSGGGALALLIAERLPETRAVLTLAGNLDIAAWTALHGYTPLHGSLNPAERAPLGEHLIEWHYSGVNDDNIPARLARKYLATHPRAYMTLFDGADHECCWARSWPVILSNLYSILRGQKKHPSHRETKKHPR